MANYGPWQLVFVDKVAKTIEVNDDDGRRWAFLTLRGFLEHPDSKRWVAVDHGAIPFLMNGADCMVAGVHGADEDIEVGILCGFAIKNMADRLHLDGPRWLEAKWWKQPKARASKPSIGLAMNCGTWKHNSNR